MSPILTDSRSCPQLQTKEFSGEEILVFPSLIPVMSVFGLIDQGNTGILTEDELIQWCLSCGCEIDEVSGLFDKLNKGSGGRNKRKPGRPITSDELRKGMEAQGLAFHRPSNEPVYSETAITLHNKATASRATAAKAAKRDGSTEKKLRRIFDTLDVNEDGQVSRSEMIKTLRTSPEARQLLGLPKHFRQGSKGHTQFEEVFQRWARAVAFFLQP